jgi:hypothetical protein
MSLQAEWEATSYLLFIPPTQTRLPISLPPRLAESSEGLLFLDFPSSVRTLTDMETSRVKGYPPHSRFRDPTGRWKVNSIFSNLVHIAKSVHLEFVLYLYQTYFYEQLTDFHQIYLTISLDFYNFLAIQKALMILANNSKS